MFNVTVQVGDKQLPKLLWLLDGNIIGEPIIRPVRGAKLTKNGVVSTQLLPGASLPENVAAYILKHPFGKLSRDDLKSITVEVGGLERNVPYVVQALKKARVIRNAAGSRGVYRVNFPAGAKSNG